MHISFRVAVVDVVMVFATKRTLTPAVTVNASVIVLRAKVLSSRRFCYPSVWVKERTGEREGKKEIEKMRKGKG